jgi:hypothetical protein
VAAVQNALVAPAGGGRSGDAARAKLRARDVPPLPAGESRYARCTLVSLTVTIVNHAWSMAARA